MATNKTRTPSTIRKEYDNGSFIQGTNSRDTAEVTTSIARLLANVAAVPPGDILSMCVSIVLKPSDDPKKENVLVAIGGKKEDIANAVLQLLMQLSRQINKIEELSNEANADDLLAELLERLAAKRGNNG